MEVTLATPLAPPDAPSDAPSHSCQTHATSARTSAGTSGQRVGVIAAGVGLAGAAAVVAAFDPSAPGSRFPACAFHATTGLWCPGCGLTRGVHQLLTGHPLAAMSYNVFVPLVVVAVVASWLGWARSVWGGRDLTWPSWVRPLAQRVMPFAVVAYGVARNIPLAPFRSLAP